MAFLTLNSTTLELDKRRKPFIDRPLRVADDLGRLLGVDEVIEDETGVILIVKPLEEKTNGA